MNRHSRHISNLLPLDRSMLFNFPAEWSNSQGGFSAARGRDSWYRYQKSKTETAKAESEKCLAELSIASVINSDLLAALHEQTRKDVNQVLTFTPQEILTLLAIQQERMIRN